MKLLLALLVISSFCAVGLAQEPQESDASYYLVMARLLADEGEIREATESFIKAIELSLTKYCPIANTLGGVSEITYEYSVGAG